MSSNDGLDIRFIEVSQITIRNTRWKRLGGDYRVVIKHEHGTEEIISSNRSGEEVTIDCKTFVQLNVESSIEIHRAKRIKSIASGAFNITGEEGKDYTVDLRENEGMFVNMKLGEMMTMSDVAAARVEDAKSVLEKETKSAEELERVTGHVKILMNVGAAAALVNKYANAAVSIAKLGFEKFEEIPAEYRVLKTLSLECMKHFEFDKVAREVYTSDRVREQLSSVMKLVIKALEFIFHYYSRSRIIRFTSKLTKPPASIINEVKDLASKLEAQQHQIVRIFAVEDRIFAVGDRKILQKLVDEPLLERYLGTSRLLSQSQGKAPCLLGTRVSILEKLSTWALDDSAAASRVFWLYGIAGCGKSAVAVSTSKTLVDRERLAGSFFCRRDEDSRRNPIQLFGRLAYFLAQKNPIFEDALVESLRRYDRLDDKDESTFIEYALEKPLSQSKNYTPSSPFIFLIDALDECDNSGIVAGFLVKIVAETPWIKLIVTSRETLEIKKAFIDSSIRRVDHDLFENANDEAKRDIHTYLLQRLDSFQHLNDYVDELAKKSDGLFIWLHTVTEVIINTDFQKEREEKMQAFLQRPLSGDAEERMAATYSLVLEQASGSSKTGTRMGTRRVIVRMIAGLLLATSSNTPLTISGLYVFLPPSLSENLSLNEFTELVLALKPVLKLTSDPDGPAEETSVSQCHLVVQTHHASFLDFCEKEKIPCKTDTATETSRSNPFWTDPITLHRDMAMGCFEIMKQGKRLVKPDEVPSGLRFNICGLDTSHKLNSEVDDLQKHISSKISSQLLYSSLYWASHFVKSSLDGSMAAARTKLEEMLAKFLNSTRSLFWLEVLSLTGNLTVGTDTLLAITKQSQTEIAYEMCQFVDQCFPAIFASTPHLYLSLTWLPVESQLWSAWKSEFSRASVLKDPIQQPSELLSSTTFPVRVNTFSVSPNKKHIVSGSMDGYVRLWDIRSSGIQLQVKDRQISPDASPIGALAYTPEGSHILCACGGFICELDVETLLPSAERREIPHSNIRCMAVSQVHIALGTEDGKVVILDAKTYHEVLSEQPYTLRQAVDAIAFSPDGSRLVYSSFDAGVRIWDVSSGSYRPASALGRELFVTAVAFSIDGKKIATGDWRGDVRLWDAESNEEIGSFSVKSLVQFLTFSYGTRIICAFASKKGGSFSEDLPLSSEGSRHYVSVSGYHYWAEKTSLQIWDVDFTRRQKSQSAGHSGGVSSVAFSPDGQKIVSGSRDHSVRVWDSETGEPEELAEMSHSSFVYFVTFSPDGKFIASGGYDKVIRIWDAQTGNPVQVLEGHTLWVYCGAYSPDGMRFVSGSEDTTLRIWDLDPTNRPENHASRNSMSGHNKRVTSVAFSPDGSFIASASADSTIHLWDGKTANPLGDPLSGHDSGVQSVAFSSDGTRLVEGGFDETVRIWDVRTRSAVGQPLQGHTSIVTSVVFSPDGALIFSTSSDGTIRCWNTVTGSPIGHPLVEDHLDDIWSLAVSPVGRRIVSGSRYGAIRVWDSQSFEWEADKSFVSCGYRGPDRVPDHIPEDGWIRTPEGGLLLWVPVEHREAVCTLDLFSISADERKRSKRLMWEILCHGEKWMEIRQGR